MKNTIIWIVVILVLVAGIFWYVNRSTVPAPALEEEEMSEPVVVAMNAQNDSGMTGFATLTERSGSTLVELALSGATAGVAQPSHIHMGSCAEIGEVVYPLESPVNGVSETTLDVSLDDILAKLPLAINVHKSPEEAGVYVSCADLL